MTINSALEDSPKLLLVGHHSKISITVDSSITLEEVDSKSYRAAAHHAKGREGGGGEDRQGEVLGAVPGVASTKSSTKISKQDYLNSLQHLQVAKCSTLHFHGFSGKGTSLAWFYLMRLTFSMGLYCGHGSSVPRSHAETVTSPTGAGGWAG